MSDFLPDGTEGMVEQSGAGSHAERSGGSSGGSTDTADFAARLESARLQSSQAVGALLENCRNYLLLVANSSLGPQLRAKIGASDLVQETFFEAVRLFDRFTGNNEQELLRWLSRILDNKVGNAAKRYAGTAKRNLGRERPLGGDDRGGSQRDGAQPAVLDPPSADLRANEEAAHLRTATAALSGDYQRVIDLRIVQGLSFEEIGRLMNRTAEASRKLFARAIDQLREGL
jgi:RNA polymerase sigma-70 factor (ECF subfamily)